MSGTRGPFDFLTDEEEAQVERAMTGKIEAKKDDSQKIDLSLNPKVALEQMAVAFMLGEKKYGRYNYTNGMDASRLIGACLRHVHTWMDGEDTDAESGGSHLGHALACLAMVLHQQQLGTLKDNRRKK